MLATLDENLRSIRQKGLEVVVPWLREPLTVIRVILTQVISLSNASQPQPIALVLNSIIWKRSEERHWRSTNILLWHSLSPQEMEDHEKEDNGLPFLSPFLNLNLDELCSLGGDEGDGEWEEY